MASRPLNDDEVLNEMNKMVLVFSLNPCPKLNRIVLGRLHQAGGDGEG